MIQTLCMFVCGNSDVASTEQSNCVDGELRLFGAAATNQGRLQLCLNGAWGSVCDSDGVFTTDEAKVACRQLGKLQVEGNYSFATKLYQH